MTLSIREIIGEEDLVALNYGQQLEPVEGRDAVVHPPTYARREGCWRRGMRRGSRQNVLRVVHGSAKVSRAFARGGGFAARPCLAAGEAALRRLGVESGRGQNSTSSARQRVLGHEARP